MTTEAPSERCGCPHNNAYVIPTKLLTLKHRRRDSLPDKIGSNVGKLATRLFQPLKRQRLLNIVVLGANGCGKTSIVRRFAGDMFYDKPVEPLSNTFRTYTAVNEESTAIMKEYEVLITETSRHRQSESAYRGHIKSGNAFLLVYSMDDFESILQLAKILTELRQMRKYHYPIVIAGNKADASGDLTQADVKTDFEKHAEFSGLPCFRVSAKENEGILDTFTELAVLHSLYQGQGCVS